MFYRWISKTLTPVTLGRIFWLKYLHIIIFYGVPNKMKRTMNSNSPSLKPTIRDRTLHNLLISRSVNKGKAFGLMYVNLLYHNEVYHEGNKTF